MVAPDISSSSALKTPQARLTIATLPAESSSHAAQEVISGLSMSPKTLPPKYFYDDRGSDLFEQITELPEYYLTRTETQILQQQAAAIAALTGPCELIELGSGSSTKTQILMDAYQRQQLGLRYIPIDVSGGMLEATAHRLLAAYPNLSIHGIAGTYAPALAALPPQQLPARMVAFIGSTLGNLSPQECDLFLSQVSASLSPGDYFLLGVDLQKDPAILEAAYNDSQGVTAAFNLNMLHHLNWRFQGNFKPHQFRHLAFYNDVEHQIEIYIESLTEQTAQLRGLDLTAHFEAGERLRSEISRKFNLQVMGQHLSQFDLKVLETFTDDNQWFGLMLCAKQALD